MMKLDLGMFFLQFPFFSIDLQGSMAVATRIHPLSHGRRSHGELFRRFTSNRRKTGS
jgi:hypothetical protein